MPNTKKINKTTFRVFYQKHIRLYYQFGLRFVEDIEVVRDIVQEAFIAVWQRLDEFNEEEHIRAFLYTTIRNRCLNYLRNRRVEQKNRENLWFLQSQEAFRYIAIENELYQYLCEKIDCLPPMQKAVMWLHIDGFSNEEIAQKLNITVNTVLTHKQRARAILKEFLGKSPKGMLAFLLFIL